MHLNVKEAERERGRVEEGVSVGELNLQPLSSCSLSQRWA